MAAHVIVWDIETVPDLDGFAVANGLIGKSSNEIRAEIGNGFPKLIYQSIVCIGALIADRESTGWQMRAVGAPHVGERSEKDIISSFVNKIAELRPQLITFNGSSFDLPVLRYRAMIHEVSAHGLSIKNYFSRYTDDALDLCDVLSSFGASKKVSLHELSRIMGLQGKPDEINGAEVETYFRAGKIQEIAAYCESDVVNTYRIWLRYELFRGNSSPAQFEQSERNLAEFLNQRTNLEAASNVGSGLG